MKNGLPSRFVERRLFYLSSGIRRWRRASSPAFPGDAVAINAAGMAILLASVAAGVMGFIWLKLPGRPDSADADPDTMDFEES
jgi:hypothetical protein